MSAAMALVPRAPLTTIASSPPPYDAHAERALICACIVDTNKAIEAVALVRAEQFYLGSHAAIFEAIAWLVEAGETIDAVPVLTRLRETGKLGLAGGPPLLSEILADTEVSPVAPLARAVRDAWRMRELSRLAQGWLALTSTGAYGDAQAVLEEAETSLFELAGDTPAVTASGGAEVGKAALRYVMDCGARALTGGPMGVPTGLTALDELTGGLHPGDLTVVGARPGMGKSALLAGIALAAARAGHGVLFFSLEMPREQLFLRLGCMGARVPLHAVRAGRLAPTQVTKLFSALEDLAALPMLWEALYMPTVPEMRAKAQREGLGLKRRGLPLGLVVVDYLQKCRGVGARRDTTREQEIASVAQGLKSMAMLLGLPVLVAAQVGRDVAKGGVVRRPGLTDLRESGAIEQDADNILFLHREDYAHEAQGAGQFTPTREAEIIVGKQRNGPTGTALVRFEREYTRFANLEGMP